MTSLPNPNASTYYHATPQEGLAKRKKKGGKLEEVAEPPLPGSR